MMLMGALSNNSSHVVFSLTFIIYAVIFKLRSVEPMEFGRDVPEMCGRGRKCEHRRWGPCQSAISPRAGGL